MKILFLLAQDFSGETLKGGELTTKSNYDAFVNVCGKDNIIIVSIPEEKKVYRKYVNYLCYGNIYSRRTEKKIIQQINSIEWDIIFFDGSWFGKLSESITKKGKIITFLHNVERQYSLERFKKNPLTLGKYLSVIFNEKCLMKRTDYIIALNDRDRRLVKKYYQRNTDLILPIVLEDNYICDKGESKAIPCKENSLLFVGSCFKPNEEGIIWFIKNVMPYIKCKLFIAGKGMEKIKQYESRKIIVLGTVDDLGALYQAVDAVVIPIFSGGGMKVKTAEALMYGKRIFASKEALMGYDVENISCIEECNSRDEFIQAINTVDYSEKFHDEARNLFLNNYEQSVKVKKLRKFVDKIKVG